MRDHIAEASRAAGITPDDLAPVRLTQYRQVLGRILDTFTTLGSREKNHLWLWENFKEPRYVIPAEPNHDLLGSLTNSGQRVWLVVEDWDGNKKDGNYWVFEGRIEAIEAVLKESFFFEYYIVEKNYAWLLCETHHNMLVGVGETVVEAMKAISPGLGGAEEVVSGGSPLH